MRSLTSLSLIAVLALPMPSAVALKPDTHHRLAQLDASAELPSQLRDRLLQYIHQTTAVPMADLAIVDYRAVDWSDSCLGLGGPTEICAAVITPGWSLVVTDGDHTLQYRTNADGTHLRQEAAYAHDANRSDPQLVPFLSYLVLHIESEYGVAPETLSLEAMEFTTLNGCYNLEPLSLEVIELTPWDGTLCTRTETPGIRTVLSAPGYVWVYYTALESNTFWLHGPSSQLQRPTLAPTLIPPEELPVLANPIPETLFSVIIDQAGSRYQISIYSDRSVAGYQWTRADRWAAVDLGSVSYRDFFELRDRLADERLLSFHGLSYGVSPDGDTATYTLVGGPETWIVQYDPALVDQLHPKLQQLIVLWDSLGLERR